MGNRGKLLLFAGLGLVIFFYVVGMLTDNQATVFQAQPASEAAGPQTVPWDYKLEEAKVGDLIGADMLIVPNNELLPNDQNYATGEKVWVLKHMTATLSQDAGQRQGSSNVTLSVWKPIKSYRNAKDGEADLANLKLNLQTEVDLVGVYKTELSGQFRHFAVLTLPTGHTIKQPITDERYKALFGQKRVKVTIEEVHDYADYDLAMAKFRGWAE